MEITWKHLEITDDKEYSKPNSTEGNALGIEFNWLASITLLCTIISIFELK